ncbi:phosphatidylserine decarboxylase [Halobacillus litoralis]|uniref:phosphatidylserine decarboxylase n=1 Tax=Halobacillus litoralis TaxID=45668 RepID=UPI001CD68B38|nr:phosphatidylserine decarboxylase [Halobacillus litoralis]MCA0969066.1 phosphatidylserine decarboxylase [Halobacillus litoralis]
MKRVYRMIIERLNSPYLSKLLLQFMKSKKSKRILPLYQKWFNIDERDWKQPLTSYQNMQEFFTRELKPGARPVNNSPSTITSPVDSVVEQFGDTSGHHFQVKGVRYSITTLLQNNELIERYRDGRFLVLYLSPGDYHRIHAPVSASVKRCYPLGDTSYPVNKTGLKYGKDPITSNYRVVTELSGQDGFQLAFVKVGAMWVNTIELTYEGEFVEKGSEYGYFSFGSTVVLLFEAGTIEFEKGIKKGNRVNMGEPIAVKR